MCVKSVYILLCERLKPRDVLSILPAVKCVNFLTIFCLIQVYGALRMSVKMLLMWNSKMFIDGGGDSIVATSLLEASNLVVLKVCHCTSLLSWHVCHMLVTYLLLMSIQESSVIRSNSNLGVHGQGLLNLSGPGDRIEAQRLILSLFYRINVRKSQCFSLFLCMSSVCNVYTYIE